MNPTIWTGLYADLSLVDALVMLHGEGWRSFEISTEHLEQLDAGPSDSIVSILACVRDLGVVTPQAHAFLEANVAATDQAERLDSMGKLEQHLRHCSALGVKVAVIHPGYRVASPTDAEVEETMQLNVEAFQRLGDLAASVGVSIGIENMIHGPYWQPERLVELIDRIGHSSVGITLDTSHANIRQVDIPAAVRLMDHRLIATHMSDNDGSGDQHLTPGSGSIDWPPIVASLRDIGYNGPFNLEIPGERHRTPGLRALKSRHACAVAGWLVSE